jgi:hypothetical protein
VTALGQNQPGAHACDRHGRRREVAPIAVQGAVYGLLDAAIHRYVHRLARKAVGSAAAAVALGIGRIRKRAEPPMGQPRTDVYKTGGTPVVQQLSARLPRTV